MQTLLNLTGEVLFLIAIAATFLAVACLAYGLLQLGKGLASNYQETFTESAGANMSDMFLFIDPARLFLINIGVIVILPLAVWLVFGDAFTALIVLVVVVLLPQMFYKNMRKRRLKRFEQQLPDGLMMVAGAMRAGASLTIALEGLVKEQPAPLSQEFELFLREQKLGQDLDKSLQNMENRLPLADFGMLASALRINREVGGNLAEVLESLGDTLRRKAMMEGKIDSLTAQGRLQGIVMTGLPVLLAVLLYFLEPEAMSKLWETPFPGWAVLAVIVVMLSLGYFMIRKITSIDV